MWKSFWWACSSFYYDVADNFEKYLMRLTVSQCEHSLRPIYGCISMFMYMHVMFFSYK